VERLHPQVAGLVFSDKSAYALAHTFGRYLDETATAYFSVSLLDWSKSAGQRLFVTVRRVLGKTSVSGRNLAGQTRRGVDRVQIPYKRGWIHPVNFLEMKGVGGL